MPLYMILIFLLSLFIYFHIRLQLKVNNELKLYEIPNIDKKNLEKLKKELLPITFTAPVYCGITQDYLIKKYPLKNINIKDEIVLPISAFCKLIKKTDNYYTDNNHEIIMDTELSVPFLNIDMFFKPSGSYETKYDILFGSKKATVPFKYHTFAAFYMFVSEGELTVKLSPPKSCKYIGIKKDNPYYFMSDYSPWTDKNSDVQSIDIILIAGQWLYIPPYWLYSFMFDEKTTICCLKYQTFINFCSTLLHYTTIKDIPIVEQEKIEE